MKTSALLFGISLLGFPSAGPAWSAPARVFQEGGQETPPKKKDQQPAEEKKAPEKKEKKPAESPFLAIVGGEIHTVTRGVLHGGTVLCKKDRIEAIGTGVKVPEGARVIEASGMRVYPGLVAVEARGLLGSGVSGSPADSMDPFAFYLDLGLAAGITTVQSNNTVSKLTRGSLEGAVVRSKIWVSLNYSPQVPSSRRRIRSDLTKARDFLRRLREYEKAKAKGEKDLEEPKPQGINPDRLALLKGEKAASFRANSLKDLLAICDLLEEFPMRAVIFGGQEAWACAARLGRTGADLVIYPRAKNWPDERLNRPSGWKIENARILHDAGVEFALLPQQTSISVGGIAGRDLLTLPLEAAFAIRGGLPQEAALRAITLDGAKILGVEGRVGSLEPGKDADLIVTDGDLFDYRTFVQFSVVNGKLVYDKQKAPFFAHIRPRPEGDE